MKRRTLNLKALLAGAGCKQADLARHLGLSNASVTLITNYGRFPVTARGGEGPLRSLILAYLIDHGVTAAEAATAFEECAGQRANAARPTEAAADAGASTPSPQAKQPHQPEDIDMLLRKHTITAEARTHFGLARDPFTNEMRGVADVFLNENIRRVRAAVRSTAQHGGLLAVIAESGAGKSTIRKDLAAWVKQSDQPVVLIEPYIIGMEDSDKKGRPLRAADVIEAVIRKVSPGSAVAQSYQARQRQMHELLQASAAGKNKHVVILEEAHRLSTATLLHLKNFYELEDGFESLLSVILIGQTELDWKLGDNNFEARSMVQRCEKRHLDPLDNDVEGYLKHKLARVGADYAKVFAKDAAEAVLTRLRVQSVQQVKGQRTQAVRSLCYPLAINNLVSGAMNLAHRSGDEKVSAEAIGLVGKEDAE